MTEKLTPSNADLELAAAIFAIHSALGKLIAKLEPSEQEEFDYDMTEAAESMQRLVTMWNLKS